MFALIPSDFFISQHYFFFVIARLQTLTPAESDMASVFPTLCLPIPAPWPGSGSTAGLGARPPHATAAALCRPRRSRLATPSPQQSRAWHGRRPQTAAAGIYHCQLGCLEAVTTPEVLSASSSVEHNTVGFARDISLQQFALEF